VFNILFIYYSILLINIYYLVLIKILIKKKKSRKINNMYKKVYYTNFLTIEIKKTMLFTITKFKFN